jgi:hypothetical protein
VYSNDSDALAFGSTITLRGWFGTPQDNQIDVLHLDRVLNQLGLTYDQFVDFTVLMYDEVEVKCNSLVVAIT